MNTIWKYPISFDSSQGIDMPQNAEILSVKAQHGKPVMWVMLNPSEQRVYRHFRLYTTGENIPPKPGKYIDTFQVFNDSLVYHVFETF